MPFLEKALCFHLVHLFTLSICGKRKQKLMNNWLRLKISWQQLLRRKHKRKPKRSKNPIFFTWSTSYSIMVRQWPKHLNTNKAPALTPVHTTQCLFFCHWRYLSTCYVDALWSPVLEPCYQRTCYVSTDPLPGSWSSSQSLSKQSAGCIGSSMSLTVPSSLINRPSFLKNNTVQTLKLGHLF